MASENPLHPTIDSEARSNQGSYQTPIRNALASYGPKKNSGQPRIYIPGTNTSYKNKKATQPSNKSQPSEGQDESGATRQPRTIKRGYRRKAEGTLRLLAIRAKLTPVIASVSFFSGFFYIGQLACGVIALIGLMVAILFNSLATNGGEILSMLAAQFLNLDFSLGMVIYLLGCFLIFALYFIQIAIISWVFKVAGAHPWFGRGAGLKITSIICILISSFIPLLNLLPLLYLWIFAVAANPK